MIDLKGLNPPQREAVLHGDGPLLVLAGAGSGKTRVLTHRIARLIDEGVPPWSILAITFTNKAAREMRERVERLAGDMGRDAWILTFHACCARILRRDIDKLGYKPSFTIYDADDQMNVIKQLCKSMNLDEKRFPPREIRAAISDAKNRVLSPAEWAKESGEDFRAKTISEVYAAYERQLTANNALDFDDLILKTLTLFSEHPPVLAAYQHKFSHILVDEYQDTNMAQYMLVRLIAGESRNLCVVGDDDQSIYGWRGADLRNILEFERDFPDCRVIKLEQNYRSTSNILDAANQVIAHNTGRKEKALWTDAGEGEKIRVYRALDERDEAAWVVRAIEGRMKRGARAGDFAVFYRTNAQSRVLEEAMVRRGVPYRVYGGMKFYDRKEVKDVLAYMRAVANPDDDQSVRRIINEPRRGIGDATVETLAAWARDNDDSMLGAAMEVEEIDTLGSRAAAAVKKFSDLMTDLFAHKEVLSVSDYAEYVIEQTGIKAQYSKLDDDSIQRMENIKEFLGAIQEYEKSTENPSLEDYLEQAALVTDVDDLSENSGSVTLMTMHSAKGLEFQAVFVLGCEDGLFPSSRSFTDDTRLEEERRLMYVAITRAKDQLFLTHVQKRMLYGSPQYNRASRFLKELPQDLLLNIDQTIEHHRENKPRERVAPTYFRGGAQPNVIHAKPPANHLAGSKLQAGDTVEHRKFGRGTVIGVKGNIAQVAFAGQGIKELDMQFAPMEKI